MTVNGAIIGIAEEESPVEVCRKSAKMQILGILSLPDCRIGRKLGQNLWHPAECVAIIVCYGVAGATGVLLTELNGKCRLKRLVKGHGPAG